LPDVILTAPVNVNPPFASEVGPTYLVMNWTIPTLLNGVLAGFTLTEVSMQTVYSGSLMSYNVTNLKVCVSYFRCEQRFELFSLVIGRSTEVNAVFNGKFSMY
jgi:hypothetical protein